MSVRLLEFFVFVTLTGGLQSPLSGFKAEDPRYGNGDQTKKYKQIFTFKCKVGFY